MVRFDMRGDNQLRPLSCELGIITEAAGSCKLNCGNTSVISRVYGPNQPKYSRLENYEHGTVEVELSLAGDLNNVNVSSSSSSIATSNIRKERRMIEYIKRTLESIIMLSSFPKLLILVQITLCHDDGSSLANCLNATVLALLDASIPLLCTPLSIHISHLKSVQNSLSDSLLEASDSVLIVDPTKDEEDIFALSNYIFTLNRIKNTDFSKQYLSAATNGGANSSNSVLSISSSSTISSSFSLLSSDCVGSFSVDDLSVAISVAMKTAVLIEGFIREVVNDKYM